MKRPFIRALSVAAFDAPPVIVMTFLNDNKEDDDSMKHGRTIVESLLVVEGSVPGSTSYPRASLRRISLGNRTTLCPPGTLRLAHVVVHNTKSKVDDRAEKKGMSPFFSTRHIKTWYITSEATTELQMHQKVREKSNNSSSSSRRSSVVVVFQFVPKFLN